MSYAPTQPDVDVYKTLLESTKAIPWKIDWKTMTFAYIGPQIEELLGWEPASWVSANDWAARIHAEEREQIVNFCVAQSKSGIDHEADYRALTKDGDYVWIRDVVHVVRDEQGEVDALVGFMFDISERKKTEEELIALQKKLEELSYKDSVTEIANRRMFNTILEREWADAQRNQMPLSMILLDIDYFKQFNDHYGHILGDECLKQVALFLSKAATRPRDFLARFGGEEFVLVLPETEAEAARKIAERCKDFIADAKIPHIKSYIGNTLTLSLGVATITPGRTDESIAFIREVDRRLYQAKQQGRNMIVGD